MFMDEKHIVTQGQVTTGPRKKRKKNTSPFDISHTIESVQASGVHLPGGTAWKFEVLMSLHQVVLYSGTSVVHTKISYTH